MSSSHIPTAGDVAMDLMRCARQENTDSPNFKTFFKHGLKDWKEVVQNTVDEQTRTNVQKCLERFKNNNQDLRKRMEDLHTASIFLQSYYINNYSKHL